MEKQALGVFQKVLNSLTFIVCLQGARHWSWNSCLFWKSKHKLQKPLNYFTCLRTMLSNKQEKSPWQGAVFLPLSAGELQSLSVMIRVLAYFLLRLTLLQDGNLTDVCSIIPRYVTESVGVPGISCQLRVKPWGKYVADCCRCSEIKWCLPENVWGMVHCLPVGKPPFATSSLPALPHLSGHWE